MKMLRPADDDLLEVFPVTRDLLRIKTPDESYPNDKMGLSNLCGSSNLNCTLR
jgi:hypothetical protein